MSATLSFEKKWLVPFVSLLSAMVFTYRETIAALYNQWMTNDDFSHGLLIIPISLYLIWKKRRELEGIPYRIDWRGLLLLIAGIMIYIAGELGAELFTTRVSMLVMAIGIVWLLFGLNVIKCITFPLLFMFLMLPLPGFIYRNMTFPLQIISSKLSVDMLHIFGVMAYREGNVIDMGFTQFQVVEACNGLRFIMPLFTVGVLFAFTNRKVLWKRLVLIAATIPLAIGANVVRIAGTGVVSLFWGAKAAEGFFHSFSGWAVFMICLGVFAGIYYLLNRMPGQLKPAAANGVKDGSPEMSRTVWRFSPILIAFIMILSTSSLITFLGKVPSIHLKKPLAEFPMVIDEWLGEMDTMDTEMWDRVGGQSYVMINYTGNDSQTLGFYTAYYEYQRKAGDFIHSPKLCLPGAGWFIDGSGVRRLKVETVVPGTSKPLKFNDMVISKNDQHYLVYYWYQGRGRNFTNEYLAKFYMVWDGIWRRRTDGALVRLIKPVKSDETLEDARTILDEFAQQISTELGDFLP
jgi:exosortase D (VPLPA-CTERM-specific)